MIAKVYAPTKSELLRRENGSKKCQKEYKNYGTL